MGYLNDRYFCATAFLKLYYRIVLRTILFQIILVSTIRWRLALIFLQKWHRSTFIIEISHRIIPSLSWVSIHLPFLSFYSSCPVWNSESFEDSSWSSVEWCILNSFQKSFWKEILCIDVEHAVWFFIEFLNIKVFDSNTFIIKIIILNDYVINIPASLAFSTWNL